MRARLAAAPARKKMDWPPMRCCWSRLLHAVRAWLTPIGWLLRYRRACSDAPPSPELSALLEFLIQSNGFNLYLCI